MNGLIEKIIFDDELSNEQKISLITKIINASHGIDKFLTDGFYLRAEENKETKSIDIQLWYRNVEQNGMTDHGNTNYNEDAILEFMKQTCITNGFRK